MRIQLVAIELIQLYNYIVFMAEQTKNTHKFLQNILSYSQT